jgi:hypothetical protein
MKHVYFSLLAAFCISTVKAQLTGANHAPVAGEKHQRYQCDSTGVVPGPGGANSLWNYTMATRINIVHSYTAASSSFHQPATVSLESDKSYEDHYRITPTGLQDYSSSFPIVSGYYINLNYTNPSVKAKYPMSLNSSNTSATSGFINAIMITPQSGNFNGTSSTLADATGTLMLPGITYTNVLRVVNTENISFSVQFNGTLVLKNYDYYAEGVKYPVFSITTATLTRPAATIRRTLVTRLKQVAPTDVTPESDKMVCDNLSTTLTVSGSGTIEWFDDTTATAPVASGNSYITGPLPAGVYTYYAQVTDFTATPRVAITFTVNDCTSLKETVGDRVAKIYPNPAAGLFNIALSEDITFLRIYGVDGKLISCIETKSGINTIDLTQYPEGMYFIKLMNKSVNFYVMTTHITFTFLSQRLQLKSCHFSHFWNIIVFKILHNIIYYLYFIIKSKILISH